MQVFLNTDPHVDGRHQMAEHLQTTVVDALGRYRDHITRVEAHLADTDGPDGPRPAAIQCTLEARLAGHPNPVVVVKNQADTAHQALHGAVGKLKRALSSTIGTLETRRNPGLPGDASPAANGKLTT